MANPQLFPLQINATTNEPFLRLRKHSSIIITPPRPGDEKAIVPLLTDPQISVWLANVPDPYTEEHAIKWNTSVMEACNKILKDLEAARNDEHLKLVDGCPVRVLREIQEDGSDIFIGDIGFMRCAHGEYMEQEEGKSDWENKKKREEENAMIPVGDPRIIWSFGDYIARSHQGKGIMTDAVDTLLREWGIPRMAVRHMWCSAAMGNEGSVKVFLKNGFELINTYAERKANPGKKQGLHLLEWKYEWELML
ncbi:hypothetical protein BJ165DRAFT_464031 [Panaeolus papilionaceus]|nr:hypothetical protein BJ165DRAFT_464031 [Panaeolus papilionaceus]